MLDYVPEGSSRLDTIGAMLGVALNLFLGVAIAMSTIGIIMAGIKFISSKGDYKATDKAKQALTFSIVGFILAIAAFTIRIVIVQALGGNPTGITPNF